MGHTFCAFRHSQDSLELSGKKELLEFCLVFLSSTWYIKNPYLKAKLVQVDHGLRPQTLALI